MGYLLKAENVTKQYSGHLALDGVSINVPEGKIFGLLGPNGAGKTTLIRIINRITLPDSGKVWFDGKELTRESVAKIGYLPEERGLYKKMKVGDQALFFARLKGLSRKESEIRLREWFERLGISDWWNKKVEELSKGMAQKVQFIVTVLHNPKLLIFDEPFSGFDPINANLLKREILRLRDEGATVIFSTHNMNSVEELCDDIALINRSRNILSGSTSEIRSLHAGNRYEVSWRSESEITPIPESTADWTFQSDNTQRFSDENLSGGTVEFNDKAAKREFLSKLNEKADIITFKKILPSMDDIFIRAVSTYNQESGNQESGKAGVNKALSGGTTINQEIK